MIRTACIVAITTIALGLASPALAVTRALVVGINDYAHKQHLLGSINDADQLATVLAADGVTDVVKLTDAAATRAGFETAWSRLVNASQPGDVLFFSFSGHGIREREKAGSDATPDGYDKGFLLWPYDEAAAPDEILRDEHLYDIFKLATDRGIKIVFVADACHAGAGLRGNLGATSPFRFQTYQTQTGPLTVPDPPAQPTAARPANPGVTTYTATDEVHSVEEISAPDGLMHGALSYAIALGLGGGARNDAGAVTADALLRFVSPRIFELSGSRQIPQFHVPDASLPILSAEAAPQPDPGILRDVKLAVAGSVPPPALTGATLVADPAAADLIWNGDSRQLLSPAGDILTAVLDPVKLQGAIDSRRVLLALQNVVGHQQATVAFATSGDDGQFYVNGHLATFTVDQPAGSYLTLFDLNAGGVVQLVYPLTAKGEGGPWTGDGPWTLTTPVTTPFGADFLVAIVSSKPLDSLVSTLAAFNDKPAALAAYDALRAAATSGDLRLAIADVYSCDHLENGQCVTAP